MFINQVYNENLYGLSSRNDHCLAQGAQKTLQNGKFPVTQQMNNKYLIEMLN